MSDLQASPNASIGTATEHNAVHPLDSSIAEKMSAMRALRDADRKQTPVADETAPGPSEEANEDGPVDPNGSDTIDPEDSVTEYEDSESEEGAVAPEEVSTEDSDNSTSEELIDFLEFANDNPKAKFKFMRNGKEVIIDAKKAAAILGQGSAIHEEARELKIQKAEFEEFEKTKRSELDNLTLAMSYTVQPKLKQAYDEIAKTQGYQATFRQMLNNTTDYAERAGIEADMQRNEQWIQQQKQVINNLQPQVNQFREQHKQRVTQLLENSRKEFKDKELKNTYVYNELREKIGEGWKHAKTQIVPGVDTLDIVTSDEHLLSLIRDGFKYRDKPKATTAGASIAALTTKKGSTKSQPDKKDEISKLREAANKGDRKAQDNLLMARLNQIRGNKR